MKELKFSFLVYKEMAITGLYNGSEHVVEVFDPHPNIKAMRHPRTLVSFWSHHEKMVCID